MSRFLVTWEAEVEANTDQAAAEKARAMLWRTGENSETKFLVSCLDGDDPTYDPPLLEVDVTTGLAREVVPAYDALARQIGV